jgi:hypothetical protein
MALRNDAKSCAHPATPSAAASALVSEVTAALDTLQELNRHEGRLEKAVLGPVLEVVEDSRRRLARPDLYVCVVGEKKVGKSTFLNALLGKTVLGVAVRECTGTVTFLRHGVRPHYRARLTTGKTEDFDDTVPDRHDQFVAATKEAVRRLEECQQRAATLPKEIADTASCLREQEGTHQNLLVRADECRAAQRAAADNQDKAQKVLEAFAARLRQSGQGVPWFYRHLAHWWAPWIYVPRLVALPFVRPEWQELLEQVRLYHRDAKQVAALRRITQDAERGSEEAARAVEAQANALSATRKRLASLQEELRNLPRITQEEAARQCQVAEEWEAHVRERFERFHQEVQKLTDMKHRGSQVSHLELRYPGRLLPRSLVVIDTPGVNTDDQTNRSRAWDVIRREADGCIVLSDIQQAVSASTREFVREIRQAVPHLMLVLTKVDRALAAAELDEDSAEQIDEARRVGEKRFAQVVGRDPREILSFAVAAERALRNDDPVAARRFAADVEKMVGVLKTERALIVAARCAAAIRQCNSSITEAQTRAENEYRERIATLEAQQISDPKQFCAQQLARLRPSIGRAAASAVAQGGYQLHRGMKELTEAAVEVVMACPDADALKQVGGKVEAMLRELQEAVDQAVMQEAARQAKGLERQLLSELQELYRIAERLTGTAGRQVEGQQLLDRSLFATDMAGGLQESAAGYTWGRAGGMLGGAAAGAVVGSFVPVIGTAIGAVVGGLLGSLFGPSFDAVKRESAAKVVKALEEVEGRIEARLGASEEPLAGELLRALSESLKAKVKRYRGWIDSVIEGEKKKLSQERSLLSHLLDLRKALQTHDARLQELVRQASGESFGISRDGSGGESE